MRPVSSHPKLAMVDTQYWLGRNSVSLTAQRAHDALGWYSAKGSCRYDSGRPPGAGGAPGASTTGFHMNVVTLYAYGPTRVRFGGDPASVLGGGERGKWGGGGRV